ncbi:type II toxin-antitoxin system HicB family antitoxin [Thermococcus sp. 21S7]|uniref:type II toxin-antitoxin system HicB family antitoxin n=1 Tax=Thermococcus sp. 21S7 TaxID=1638221 RepID=UPI00143C421E|nr:type II toxin-antitoxin system HicB family antitoxin [Thermococcus sp. 21S7]NJE60445.1 type II toxin-antitoxin system HicB family antitoxin [Thermococcus sp. 21S7]
MLKLKIYKEDGVWCVEDPAGYVVGCGRTIAEAFKNFGENLEAAMEEYVEDNDLGRFHISAIALRYALLDWLR